jgi:hypothetical protein
MGDEPPRRALLFMERLSSCNAPKHRRRRFVENSPAGKKSQVIRVHLQNRLSGEHLTNAPPAIPNIEQVGASLIEPAMRLTDAHGQR